MKKLIDYDVSGPEENLQRFHWSSRQLYCEEGCVCGSYSCLPSRLGLLVALAKRFDVTIERNEFIPSRTIEGIGRFHRTPLFIGTHGLTAAKLQRAARRRRRLGTPINTSSKP